MEQTDKELPRKLAEIVEATQNVESARVIPLGETVTPNTERADEMQGCSLPAWKRPALRMKLEGGGLSQTILEERNSGL